MTQERPTKIALIGATGNEYSSPEARVDCFSWDRLRKATNLSDYDIVILNLLSLDDAGRLDSASFRKMLDVQTAQEVLGKEDGAIFVLGDPRFNLEWQEPDGVHSEPFLAWTGIEFSWDDRHGDTVERSYAASGGVFKPFADKLARWSYSLAECRAQEEEYAKVWNVPVMRDKGARPTVMLDKICENSYGNALVFSVGHAVDRYSDMTNARLLNSRQTDLLSGPVFFLPQSQLSEEATLEFVLRDLCGVNVSAPEPEWITEFVAPGQEKVDSELAELEDRIQEMIEERERKVEERTEVREPLKLLYQKGAALEEVVCWALEELGAEVERPEERNKEDGWIVVEVGDDPLEGVLEIKSTDKQHFGSDGLGQLFEWISRGVSLKKKRYTGIFVGNSSTKEPPTARHWPFNPNWVKDAQLYKFAAIRSEDLYVLYLLDRTNKLNRDGFWRELFSTKGPFDMSPYRKKLTDEEKDQLENLSQE